MGATKSQTQLKLLSTHTHAQEHPEVTMTQIPQAEQFLYAKIGLFGGNHFKTQKSVEQHPLT